MRRIFVGDIQGCADPLRHLLAEVDFKKGDDVLYPVGDLVNKGPDSPGVLSLLMELDAQPVLGNHDLHYLDHDRIEDPSQRKWLRSQPHVRILPDLILIHAGLHPHWTEDRLLELTEPEISYAANVRYCDPDGNRPPSDWPPPGPPYRPWDDFYGGDKRVIFGHWARRGLVVSPKALGLDTGCVYGGKMSAWIAEEDRIVQVDGWKGPTP